MYMFLYVKSYSNLPLTLGFLFLIEAHFKCFGKLKMDGTASGFKHRRTQFSLKSSSVKCSLQITVCFDGVNFSRLTAMSHFFNISGCFGNLGN